MKVKQVDLRIIAVESAIYKLKLKIKMLRTVEKSLLQIEDSNEKSTN